jgi:terminase, large subunit
MNPWQWSEEHLELSARSTPFPGHFTTARTPFVRGPLEAFWDPAIRKVTLCFSAQSGKTTVLSVALAYVIDQAPGPILYALPSENAALSFSKNRLQPLIQDSPVLARHVTDRRHDFKGLEMILDRVTLYLVGAATPAQLAMRPVRYLFCDEVDKWPPATSREADSLSLAIERVKSFRNHKIVLASTPTTDTGPIWQNFQAGSRELFNIQCEECKTVFPVEWENIKWPKGAGLEVVRDNTWLECPSCQQRYTERDRGKILQGGEWLAENAEAPADHRSFRINELVSPVSRWGDLVVKFLTARAAQKAGDLGPLHSFINSSLAQPWSEPEHQAHAKPEHIQRLCDDRMQGELPDQPIACLTAGIDSQDDGFFVVIRAWGENFTSWLVREFFIPDAEMLVEIIINSRFNHPSGQQFPVIRAFIDSGGHRTAEVYEMARRAPVMMAIKGEQRLFGATWKSSMIDKYPGRDGKQRPIPGGLQLVRLDTTFYKDTLSAKLNLDPGQPGSMNMPRDLSGDYLAHLTAEYRDAKGIWQKPKHKRCDYWDCEVYALAAADILKVRDWRAKQADASSPRQKKRRILHHGPQENPYLASRNSRW